MRLWGQLFTLLSLLLRQNVLMVVQGALLTGRPGKVSSTKGISAAFLECLAAINPEATCAATRVIADSLDAELYDQERQNVMINYQTYPAAIFYACTTGDVADAVQCANQFHIKVSAASGRHGFVGAALPTGYLAIDLSYLNKYAMSADNSTITIGPGATNGRLLTALHRSGISGAAVATGGCTFVGLGGYMLGGGLGFLGRVLGLGCDRLLNVEMVLADGTVVNANKDTYPDLFWASCGGGGGTFGIVTAFTFQISILPNRGQLVGVTVTYAAGSAPFVESHMAFQDWLPTASRLWGIDNADITPSPQGPVFGFQGVYFGEAAAALQELQDGGVLDNLCMDPVRCAFNNVPGYPMGVSMVQYESFYDFYLDTQAFNYLSPALLPGQGLTTLSLAQKEVALDSIANALWGYPYTPFVAVDALANPSAPMLLQEVAAGEGPYTISTCSNTTILAPRVVGGNLYNEYQLPLTRIFGPMPRSMVEDLAQLLENLARACAQGVVTACLVGFGGHTLTGAYTDKSPTETAFFFRNDMWIQFISLTTSAKQTPYLSDKEVKEFVRDFIKPYERLVARYFPRATAYANYQNPLNGPLVLKDWQHGYWGENYARLREIKSKKARTSKQEVKVMVVYVSIGILIKAYIAGTRRNCYHVACGHKKRRMEIATERVK
ncbi:fad linked oxidase domain protein [Nannochloropsis gaditana]|uniref:Fad linked oxidase domain protein n=1 Tax=Nannochloropsis gaditana TaxID=72520 RepID=W7T0E6_9STRA|nr:fad linked oxidase domain protein [Nannochloropsis gaditana]